MLLVLPKYSSDYLYPTYSQYIKYVKKCTPKKVEISIPVFTQLTNISFKQYLKLLNMADIFESELGNINEFINIENIAQRSEIKIYNITTDNAYVPSDNNCFKFNIRKQFSYFIVHTDSDFIMYSGKYNIELE
jgi:serine protease inhibitor